MIVQLIRLIGTQWQSLTEFVNQLIVAPTQFTEGITAGDWNAT